jgi:23S rRNA (guanine745-N1)-methyltransferase
MNHENILVCPKCKKALDTIGKSLVCENRHTYDISKSGYVNLNLKPVDSGDSVEMVRSRSRFLDSGYYFKFADAITSVISDNPHNIIVDAGCGEGYYSEIISRKFPKSDIYGFDLSKSAVQKSAKRTKELTAFFAVCSIFDLPLRTASADVVINLFAPCAAEEFARVLKPGGILIMGVAGEDHLFGLKSAIYENVYLNTPEKVSAPEGFAEKSRHRVKYTAHICGTDTVKDLFAMTPYYWKTSKSDADKLNNITELDTLLDFDIVVFERTR